MSTRLLFLLALASPERECVCEDREKRGRDEEAFLGIVYYIVCIQQGIENPKAGRRGREGKLRNPNVD
jgi:hypothetical protein